MKTSRIGIEFIKKFEGCKLKAYKPVPTEKYYSIGYGHYGADVKKGMEISQSQAEAYLVKDLATAENALNITGVNFTQNQFDSLVSWIYNLGVGNFKSSTMRKYIIARKESEPITDQMVKWVNSNGKPLLGLKRRRVAEANMFIGKELYYIDNSGKIKKH